ncbi:MAG: NADH-quinone oxidoreductase subunit NuoH [Candidatus Omnitrophica bacterium]|nr:NADH-quinone oxidoreductase subunit NuoH [Candidatus Omnitrophota bacterium]
MLDQLFVHATRGLLTLPGRMLPPALNAWVGLLLPIAAIAALAPAVMMYLTWLERKIIARMQNRLGPNRVGLFGLTQPLADGVKMLIKEDIVPAGADRLLHVIAPVTALLPAILLFAVLPVGRNMAAVDLNVGALYILAVSSISSLAVFMGGWASRNKFSVLGAMRAVAQIISYEVPSVLSVVAVIMVTGSLSLVAVVNAQAEGWFIATPWGAVAALTFFLSGIAEVNRTPFDMPEAESELVAGFHTEYSGMKFALWYMAEFLEAFAVCAFTTTLFLGGWQGPAWPVWPWCLAAALVLASARTLAGPLRLLGLLGCAWAAVALRSEVVPSWAWFLLKTYALVFVLVWLRGTFPRLRADQLMGFAWKFLLPLALVNIIAAGCWSVWPGLRGSLIALGLLVGSAWALIRVNAPASEQRRTYVLVE